MPDLHMIDIHCHPLPEVDDGASSFDDAVAMCKIAAEDGITHLVATPHCSARYVFQPEVNRQKLDELQAAIGGQPKLLLGCDFHLSYENIRQLLEDHRRFAINRTDYVLVEFDSHFVPELYDRVFYDLQVAGVTPILTHPERNEVFGRKPEILYPWVVKGCLVQITAQSYTGHFGRQAEQLATKWLARNLVHFFASDAHDTEHRPPILSHCYQKLAEVHGEEVADRVMQKNPEAVIQGVALPAAPQPIGPSDSKPKKGVLGFFRR